MRRHALLIVIGILLAGCTTTTKSDATTLKIGFIGPLTGDAAALGVDILHGVELAVEEVNAHGGINGKTVEVVAEDGRCTGTDAASAAQKLVNVDHVVAILGGQCSGETLAAAPIVEAAHIPLISAISSNPDVTDAGDFVFRVYPSDALKTVAMAAYFQEKGWTKVAILSTNADFSIGFRDALKKQLPQDFVFDETVDPDAKDFRAVLQRLKDQDVDVFVPNAHANAPMALMIKQFREQGFTAPLVSHDVADALDVIASAGDAAEGMQVINVPTIDDSTPLGKKFTAAYGTPQAGMYFAAFAYDAANVLFAAMKTAGSTDGQAIVDALGATKDYPGAVGSIGFDKNGDVTGVPYALKEVKNGTFEKVKDLPL